MLKMDLFPFLKKLEFVVLNVEVVLCICMLAYGSMALKFLKPCPLFWGEILIQVNKNSMRINASIESFCKWRLKISIFGEEIAQTTF
jgi:hypothetical protein